MNMKVEYLTNKMQDTKIRWYGHVLKTKVRYAMVMCKMCQE